MTLLNNYFPEYDFNQEERILTYTGLALGFISVLIVIIEKGIAPFFTRFNWTILSTGWHIFLTGSSLFLLWKGLGQALYLCWGHHRLYKVVCWIILKSTAFFLFIFRILIELIDNHDSSSNKNQKVTDVTSDDIWKMHPKHYDQKDPPKPFSD